MSKVVAAALPLVGISAPGWLALIALVCAVGCKTPIGSRKDGGPGVEAGLADASLDILATPDLARPDITQLPSLDAGSQPDAPASEGTPDSKSALDAPADSPLTDTAPAREVSSEPTSNALADVAGLTFQIAASDAIPDAGLYGRSCGTSNPGAVYRLTFSADGTKVEIERIDGLQEAILNGTLQPGSSSTIRYDLAPTFAGGSLSIRRENGNLVGSLAIYGSGVPVIWCIESPMKSA